MIRRFLAAVFLANVLILTLAATAFASHLHVRVLGKFGPISAGELVRGVDLAMRPTGRMTVPGDRLQPRASM